MPIPWPQQPLLQLQQNRACAPLHCCSFSRIGRARRCMSTQLIQQERACAPPMHFNPDTQTLQTVWERGSDPHNGRYYGSIGAGRHYSSVGARAPRDTADAFCEGATHLMSVAMGHMPNFFPVISLICHFLSVRSHSALLGIQKLLFLFFLLYRTI